MTERKASAGRNGVRVGQRVRDVDGRSVGRVDAVYESGFSVVKGLPLLFRTDFVVGYDEVAEVRNGEVVIARGKDDLFALARGELPPSRREVGSMRSAGARTDARPAPAAGAPDGRSKGGSR